MFKKTKVVMLPNTKEAIILFNPSNNKLTVRSKHWSVEDCITIGYQTNDLYFLSDEDIKEGDWCIYNGLVHQATNYLHKSNQMPHTGKIIASTDKSLGLPRPSDSFIKKYCELGGIEYVNVEYENIQTTNDKGNIWIDGHKLKVAPDNTVTIKAVKDSWNREEMIEFAKKAYDAGSFDNTNSMINLTFDKWIEENL